jgi:dTDP-glucose pyrophosphorylase
MWGIIPAAGIGSRIQPLAFSKELLPVGSRFDGKTERPRAVSEYLVERMIRAGVTNLCFVISPGKTDIIEYFGANIGSAHVVYTVQPRPAGLCDAIFRAMPLVRPEETVVIGLPDTVWFPADALCQLPEGQLGFLLFLVGHPELFDSVVTDEKDNVLRIDVKTSAPETHWIWGAFKMPGAILHELFELWSEKDRHDEYFGTLINAYVARGGKAIVSRANGAYVDIGTVHGYREAVHILCPDESDSSADVTSVLSK